jgi:hypothetical protein
VPKAVPARPGRPGAGGDDDARRRQPAPVGDHVDAAGCRLDREHALLEAQVGAVAARLGELRGDDPLGKEHAGSVLEVAAFAIGDEECGKALADRRRIEQLVGDAEALRQGDRLGEEAGLAVVLRDVGGVRADHQAAGAALERLAARRLELGPELVRAQCQRHEGRAFADGEPGDAGQAVARALVVRRPEAVDADDLGAARAQVVAERAADRAEADDDRVRGGRHPCGAIVRIRHECLETGAQGLDQRRRRQLRMARGELPAVERVRHAPQVRHARQLARHRRDQSDGADQGPRHRTVAPAPRRREAEGLGGRHGGGEEFAPGRRMPGEVEALERRAVVVGGGDEGAGEVGQVGPGVDEVERSGIDELADGDRLDHRLVEPAAGCRRRRSRRR